MSFKRAKLSWNGVPIIVGRLSVKAHLAGANRLIREAFYWDFSLIATVPLRKPKQRRWN